MRSGQSLGTEAQSSGSTSKPSALATPAEFRFGPENPYFETRPLEDALREPSDVNTTAILGDFPSPYYTLHFSSIKRYKANILPSAVVLKIFS